MAFCVVAGPGVACRTMQWRGMQWHAVSLQVPGVTWSGCAVAWCGLTYHSVAWLCCGVRCHGLPWRTMAGSVVTLNISCYGYWSNDILHSLISLNIIIKSKIGIDDSLGRLVHRL